MVCFLLSRDTRVVFGDLKLCELTPSEWKQFEIYEVDNLQ